uniref:SPRY domain-containing SOCS box protein 1 n=1 Tax=Strongyloides venezuelensis TaxID=75913 RepID=A0A0K0FCH8_STRVS
MMGQTPSRNETRNESRNESRNTVLGGTSPNPGREEANLFDFIPEDNEFGQNGGGVGTGDGSQNPSSIAIRNRLAYRFSLHRIHQNLLQFNRQFPSQRPSSETSRRQLKLSCNIGDDEYKEYYDADIGYPEKFKIIIEGGPPDRKVMEEHAWNPNDSSLNIYVKDDDPLTLHRNPVAQSTDCIRGKVGFKKGFHVWKITWPLRQRGTHAVIGVATKNARLQSVGYTSLIGSTVDSYGWDIVRLKCSHDGRNNVHWGYPNENWNNYLGIGESFSVPESIYCILDMDEGYMAFATEEEYLGVAFRGLRGKELFPIVSAVWGHCEITMEYMGGVPPEAPSLMSTCRRAIRSHVGRKNLYKIFDLDLPNSCIEYLLYR